METFPHEIKFRSFQGDGLLVIKGAVKEGKVGGVGRGSFGEFRGCARQPELSGGKEFFFGLRSRRHGNAWGEMLRFRHPRVIASIQKAGWQFVRVFWKKKKPRCPLPLQRGSRS